MKFFVLILLAWLFTIALPLPAETGRQQFNEHGNQKNQRSKQVPFVTSSSTFIVTNYKTNLSSKAPTGFSVDTEFEPVALLEASLSFHTKPWIGFDLTGYYGDNTLLREQQTGDLASSNGLSYKQTGKGQSLTWIYGFFTSLQVLPALAMIPKYEHSQFLFGKYEVKAQAFFWDPWRYKTGVVFGKSNALGEYKEIGAEFLLGKENLIGSLSFLWVDTKFPRTITITAKKYAEAASIFYPAYLYYIYRTTRKIDRRTITELLQSTAVTRSSTPALVNVLWFEIVARIGTRRYRYTREWKDHRSSFRQEWGLLLGTPSYVAFSFRDPVLNRDERKRNYQIFKSSIAGADYAILYRYSKNFYISTTFIYKRYNLRVEQNGIVYDLPDETKLEAQIMAEMRLF